MSEISNVARGKAKNAQHVQLVTDVSGTTTQEVATEQGFGTQWTNFTACAQTEVEVFKPEKKLATTEQVASEDENRDNSIYLYKIIAKAYADYSADPEKKQAGKDISYAFEQAGDVAKMDYASQTATTSDLVAQLRKEPCLSALEKLNISTAPDEIEAANEAFNEVYKNRSSVERQRAKRDMAAVRKASDAAMDELFKAINALYLVNEMVTKDESKREVLQKIIDQINDLLFRFDKTVNGGSSMSPGDEGGSGAEPTTPPEGSDDQNPDEGGGGSEDEDDAEQGIPHP